jgi:hypothetical protein
MEKWEHHLFLWAIMGHLYHGDVSHNERVSKNWIFGDWIFGESLSTKIVETVEAAPIFSRFDQGIPQRYGGYSIILGKLELVGGFNQPL